MASASASAEQVILGVRSGGEGWGGSGGAAVGETIDYGEGVGGGQVHDGAAAAAAEEHREDEDQFAAEEEEEEAGWPEYPWWPVLADAIETALRSMSLEELNHRMSVS